MKIKHSISLEQQCNDIWGSSQFDWTIGKTVLINDYDDPSYNKPSQEVWFWFSGMNKYKRWLHEGYANTIDEALRSIIDSA
jgi:hypothetical protein